MTASRLPKGGRIDRARTVRFTFDGKAYSGHPGDTLASALLANGVTLFGRSFKYHRPRGVFAAGSDEPNALVTVLNGDVREPNVRATELEIHDGLVTESQNRFPSLEHDVMAINQLAGPILSAGFYYKTFMGPAIGPLRSTKVWMFFEKFIRRAAGLGRAGIAADPDHYERMNAFCDVLVVGTGPAGLLAAEAAAETGAQVIIAEERPVAGGALLASAELIDGRNAAVWAREKAAALAGRANVRFLTRTSVWGYYDGNVLTAIEHVSDFKPNRTKGQPRQRHWVIRTGKTILATGAFERPIVFPGNDCPGVMLADAVRRYAVEYGVAAGTNVTLFTNNDSAYEAARAMAQAGVNIVAIVDVRADVSGACIEIASAAGAELVLGHAVTGTHAGKTLSSITVQHFNAQTGHVSGAAREIKTDCLGVSGGWSPAIHLASQAGGKPEWDEDLQAFLPPEANQNWVTAGSAAGYMDTVSVFSDGATKGTSSKIKPKLPAVDAPMFDASPAPVFEIEPAAKSQKAFVDFQHDVTADDIRLAYREGFHSVEHLKRYTTLGMATDQGKTSNIPGLAIMADVRGITIPEAGTTRFRPPFTPVSFGAIAGERYGDLRPHRLTPMHDWHLANSARTYEAGLWHRPMIYGSHGETVEQAYVREARAVRQSVGIVDVSTLGKIDIQGPDAGEFLDRVYTNMFSTLPVGKARYGLMLREDGIVYDDGTTWRLSETQFLMTTTTANAGNVMQHLEFYLDCVWPDLRVHLTSVTDVWAGTAVSGPKARAVLEACVTGTGVDNTTLPFMGIVHGFIGDVPVMICRLSFSGELAYEVYCGAGYGTQVWEALLEAGKPFDIMPYGLEALGTLRIEKGHVTGAEIDGRTTAHDLHLDWMLSKKKPYIGSGMKDRAGLNDENRLSLVGLISLDNQSINGGSHIVSDAAPREPADSFGHVTAACYSPALGKYIALALVKHGTSMIGNRAYATDLLRGKHGAVEIVSHHMFDPEGSRMHG
ncbi:sarcosine oxidase subunit alpha family protein [uncultured Phyllobacterium sp.]|uniref:sarcosine oxidase subunit alpha family protein n=1 Tax=uncultured Phyllobacterium sp. TaxID=253813 RepID=UPI0025911237|nr:sarcosine oxidase subunit alpha family protein [uncultured Phyllobacterium sp.]